MELNLMIISAVLAIVCTAPLMLSGARKGAYRTQNEILIEEATRAGRVAVGILVATRFLPGDPSHKNPLDRDDRWLGTYSYEINGKTYTCGVSTADNLPKTLRSIIPRENRPKVSPR